MKCLSLIASEMPALQIRLSGDSSVALEILCCSRLLVLSTMGRWDRLLEYPQCLMALFEHEMIRHGVRTAAKN